MAIGLLEKVSPTTYTQSVLARLFLWILMERFDFQFKKRSNFRCHIPGFTALWWNFPLCWPHLCHQPVLSPGRILVCYSILLNMSPVEIKGWGMGWSLTTGQFVPILAKFYITYFPVYFHMTGIIDVYFHMTGIMDKNMIFPGQCPSVCFA